MSNEWTEQQEAAFTQIMAAGKLERLPAIRLYRRCNDDLNKALRIASDYATVDRPGASLAILAKARAAKAA